LGVLFQPDPELVNPGQKVFERKRTWGSKHKHVDIEEYVTIIVVTVNKYTATVIKTGNSYALRVPKKYIDDSALTLGQKIQVSDPLVVNKVQNRKAIQQAIRNLQKLNAFSDIKDPVAWQREIRKDRPLPDRE
jgi:antitoxin component of MazEF toxin-antitoxin module